MSLPVGIGTMRFKRIIASVLAGGLLFLLLSFFISANKIGQGVKDVCERAQEKYKDDCVESLIKFVNDDGNSFKSRNSAIWALGQLGDGRALPVLEKYYTGNIPKREPLDKTISQYELKKAIKLAKGGLNITAFVWRKNI